MPETITQMLHALKLGGLARDWASVEYKDREQYLIELLRLEIREREKNRVNRLIKKAGFRVIKTLDGFKQSPNLELPVDLPWDKLISLEFIRKKENLILMGPVGVGKTHLATALGVKACQEGYETRFFTAASLATVLTEEGSKGGLNRFMEGLRKVKLIVLDEVGFVPLHKEAAKLLFQVVSDAYESVSLIITSNLELSQWNSIFGDKVMTAALIDRLVHHSHFMIFSGASYRLNQSMQKRQGEE